MLRMVVLLVFTVVSLMVQSAQAQDYTEADVSQIADEIAGLIPKHPAAADAVNNLSADLMYCSVNTMFAATCLSSSQRAEDVAQRMRGISNWTGKLSLLLGLKVGVTTEASMARMQLSVDDLKRQVPSCRNMSILTLAYGTRCRELVSNPALYLQRLLCRKDRQFCSG